MYQDGKIVAWRLIALLLVLSISTSLLVMSPMLALADTNNTAILFRVPSKNKVFLGIWRPTGSTVGSVRIKLTSGQIDQCVNIPAQNTVYGFNTVGGSDTVTIQNFPGANCQGNRDSNKDYTDSVNSLPPGSTDGTHRVYMTPKEA